jgi:hypothetical protein
VAATAAVSQRTIGQMRHRIAPFEKTLKGTGKYHFLRDFRNFPFEMRIEWYGLLRLIKPRTN